MSQACKEDNHQGNCCFVVDPTDPFRYVCLKCGLERSIKKKEEFKKKKPNIPINQFMFLGVLIAGLLLLLYNAQEENQHQGTSNQDRSNVTQAPRK
ncbi:hypothetical protein V2H45_02450 [Tumidithrix elongata RA019]|uniref:Uncharacterized protein n=1 Tax=Tumidithrix elongata BACA0141 TaxID=2716417 RepID=A0AAW9PTF2_9CYAN|nr:hypothetical protein [Tumidithrix elongata RA019]